jgi:hypothetical protein
VLPRLRSFVALRFLPRLRAFFLGDSGRRCGRMGRSPRERAHSVLRLASGLANELFFCTVHGFVGCVEVTFSTKHAHLATAMGVEACDQGRKVRFWQVAELITHLIEAREERQLLGMKNQVAKSDRDDEPVVRELNRGTRQRTAHGRNAANAPSPHPRSHCRRLQDARRRQTRKPSPSCAKKTGQSTPKPRENELPRPRKTWEGSCGPPSPIQ